MTLVDPFAKHLAAITHFFNEMATPAFNECNAPDAIAATVMRTKFDQVKIDIIGQFNAKIETMPTPLLARFPINALADACAKTDGDVRKTLLTLADNLRNTIRATSTLDPAIATEQLQRLDTPAFR